MFTCPLIVSLPSNSSKVVPSKFILARFNVIDPVFVEKDFKSNQEEPPERILKLQLVYQLSRISKHRGSLVNDDIIDALSGAVGYWTEYMSADEDRNIKDRKDELLMTHLANWGDSLNQTISQTAMGMTPQQIRNSNTSSEGFISKSY